MDVSPQPQWVALVKLHHLSLSPALNIDLVVVSTHNPLLVMTGLIGRYVQIPP